METTNTLGPAKSWRLVHDGETVILLAELEGYTETINFAFEGPTRSSCMIEVYRLGLSFQSAEQQ